MANKAAPEPNSQPQQMTIDQALANAYAHWSAGHADQAEMLCQRILAAWPGHPDALHLLGLMAHNWGNLDLALDYLRQACRSPRAPPVFFSNLAEMCRQRKLMEEAESMGRRAVEMDSGLAGGWNNLGIILQETGRLSEALSCLQRVVALKPDFAEAHNNLGNTFKKMGQLDRARQCYDRALQLMPDYPEAHSNLSNLLKEQSEFDRALAEARLAIDLNPRLGDAYINAAAVETARLRHAEALRWINALLAFAPGDALGLAVKTGVLIRLDRVEEALETARAAVTAGPASGDAYSALGRALQAMHRFDEALAAFDIAAHLESAVAEQALIDQGVLLMEINRQPEAREAFMQARRINPLSVASYFNMADMKKFTAADPELKEMENMLAGGGVQNHIDRISLHFALAKGWMDAGDDARGFGHLHEGNRMKRATLSYDAAQFDHVMEEIAAAFPAALFDGKITGALSDKPVFIIGMPRSGTTLIEQILAAHPAMYGAGELSKFRRACESLRDNAGQTISYPAGIASVIAEAALPIGQTYLAAIEKLAPDARHVIDKMPANFAYAGLIALALPQARIIHCRRNAMDTCLSCYTKLFSAEQDFSYDMKDLGAFYRAYDRLMAHWRAVLPPERFIEVDYEAVVDNLEQEARRLVDFCGVAWDPACLEFYKGERPVHTASANQVRQPIYKASVGRWKRYAQHLGPLLDSLGTLAAP